jgi:hypothetical protein
VNTLSALKHAQFPCRNQTANQAGATGHFSIEYGSLAPTRFLLAVMVCISTSNNQHRKHAGRKAGLLRSQLAGVKRFSRAFAQGVGGEFFQFRAGMSGCDDALPSCVIRLMLQEAGEIHHRARLVFGQCADEFDQFFGCRSHAETLNPPVRDGKCPLCCSVEPAARIGAQRRRYNEINFRVATGFARSEMPQSNKAFRLDSLSVGSNVVHGPAKVFEALLKMMSSASPNFLFGPAERTMKFVWPAISI